MAISSLTAQRDELVADPSLQGERFCRALSDLTDDWIAELAESASGGSSRKLVLLAIGGYGRRELCPFSDLDLLLVHDGRRDIRQVADALWYPIWDQGVHIDHAVRRPKDVLDAASKDLRVALGLLDARVVWGEARVGEPLIEKVRQLWRSKLAADFLPALEEQMDERHRSEGDVAFLLEPNLKEAHGGLRDVSVLRALPSCAPQLSELVDLDVIKGAAATLTAVRVELHRNSGRALDTMLLQEQDAVAAALGFDDADLLCSAVSEAGRSIARLSDETWRRRPLWAPGSGGPAGRAERVEVEPGVVIGGGEAGLTTSADVTGDPSLAWRLAAVAAEHDLPINLGAAHRLGDLGSVPEARWPQPVTDALIRLLLAGHRAIPAFESLDQVGLVSRYLPEWAHVRYHHQRNAYHRFTVDRHLLETAANAAELVDSVERPDLLVIGALFHDIGKGLPGDHTELGIDIIAGLGTRLGFPPADVAILQSLVRNHLLLADTATRRDLSDPVTIERVADAVRDRTTLRLLGALTKADSLATGSSAWGGWKEQLVNELVVRTDAFLVGSSPPEPTPDEVHVYDDLLAAVRLSGEPEVKIEPPGVVIAAPDRPGLLADVAGTLALNGLDVHTANAASVGTVAIDTFTVETASGRWPEAAALRSDLLGVLEGRLDLRGELERRSEAYASARRTWSAHPVVVSVAVDNDASLESTVIEVRATDEIGLLHRLTSCLFSCGLDVDAARVATIGGEVVDAFYVRSPEGGKIADPEQLAAVTERLRSLLRGSGGGAGS
jgi:[protein-PII] uridylyltransferase